MTRAFISLFEGDLLKAISYNLLCIPCLLFFIYYIFIDIISIIKNDDRALVDFENWLGKHYKAIIIVLVINKNILNFRIHGYYLEFLHFYNMACMT